MNNRKTVFVPCRMSPAEVAALRQLADERSCSVAAVLRWAVKKAVLDGPSQEGQEKHEGGVKVGSRAAALVEVRP